MPAGYRISSLETATKVIPTQFFLHLLAAVSLLCPCGHSDPLNYAVVEWCRKIGRMRRNAGSTTITQRRPGIFEMMIGCRMCI